MLHALIQRLHDTNCISKSKKKNMKTLQMIVFKTDIGIYDCLYGFLWANKFMEVIYTFFKEVSR